MCGFYKFFVVTGMITKAIHKSSEEEKKEEEVKKTLEQHDNIVTQYKELIREQVHTAEVVLPCSVLPVVLSSCVVMSSPLLNVFTSGCSNPGAEGAGFIHVLSERTDADHHHPAAVPDSAAQRPVQHPQAKIRWVQLIAPPLASVYSRRNKDRARTIANKARS